jgi:hypothetical protein
MEKNTKTFIEYRRSIYASINGTKGNLVKLSKSRLLTKIEKEKLQVVIDSIEDLRAVYCNPKINQ